MIHIPPSVIEEQKQYSYQVQEFKKGNIDLSVFKPYCGLMGVYEQRQSGQYMIRARIPSGIISLEQFIQISKLSKRYDYGILHLTTREDIQFHKLSLEQTAEVSEALLEIGLITKGAGGSAVRNIAISPLSGVSEDEVFDVTPYADAATDYILKDPTAFNLPRKFKISFSNSEQDTANATISDLGFIAKIENGKKGFVVYGAGGLGGSSIKSLVLSTFIEVKDILYYVQAMKELFENEGDRTNRNKARMRYIYKRLGEEAFMKKFEETLDYVRKRKNLDLTIDDTFRVEKNDGIVTTVKDSRLIKQKQAGYYSIYIHPENGNLSITDLDSILKWLSELTYEISIRLTNTQGFYVRDLNGNDANDLLKLISSFTSPDELSTSVACTGAANCRLGLCFSQNLLSAIIKRFKNEERYIKELLPRIYISGCSNSCGQHQKGQLGFTGKAKKTKQGVIPMYSVFLGGNIGNGKTNLGISFGDIPARKIPDFLVDLALLRNRIHQVSFEEFISQHQDEIRQLINKWGTIGEDETEDICYDFGSEVRFSLDK